MAAEPRNRDGGYGVAVFFTAILLLSITFFAGCQSINPLPGFGVDEPAPEEARIKKLMKWHSGRVEVYSEFRTVFTARAVYLSDEIRWLVADWEAKSNLMSPEERDAFEEKFLKDDAPIIKVLVGFYTPEEDQNNLSDENSVWTPYLKNPDGSVTRAACLDMDEDNSRIFMRFLKWDLSWSKLYLLCFPYSPDLHSPEDGWLSMMISGPSGIGEIRLQIDPPVEQP
jgi:hypothetical protein